MSKNFKEDLTGQRFGRWTVLEFVPNDSKYSYWKCRCDCGNIKLVIGTGLKSGSTVSCGCYRAEAAAKLCRSRTTHSLRHHRLYGVWNTMKGRCYNPKNKGYRRYGGRGITICNEWLNDFKVFYDWAMTNGYKEGLSIDRIDVNGNYEPSNCRFVDIVTQSKNRRSNIYVEYQGKKIVASEAAELSNMPYKTLLERYHRGDRGERLFRPIENKQLKS